MNRQPTEQLLNQFVALLDPLIRGSVPPRAPNNKIPVDMINEEKTIYIYAELPGVQKENITVDFYNNKLTISVEKNRSYDNPNVSEIMFGHFERVLTLPMCITRQETVTVTFINGTLKIKINKLIEDENRFSLHPGD